MRIIFFVSTFLISNAALSQSFENTLFLKTDQKSPQASLADVSWIQGLWRGEAFGGITEEIWSPPLGGSMMCAFKLVVNDKIKFYEIITISEVDNSLILKLKHFDSSLKGWEEKDETVDFPLVKITPNKVFFDGFTFEKVSENELIVYVVTSNDGIETEVEFPYQRVK